MLPARTSLREPLPPSIEDGSTLLTPPVFAGLSCADYSWPKLNHQSALRLIRDLEMDAVDIGLFRGSGHLRPELVIQDPARWAGAVGERTAANGLAIADVFLQVGQGLEACAPNNPDADVRREQLEMLRQVVRFAAAVGAPGVTVLPGIPFGDESSERAIERAAVCLAPWIEIARSAGLALSVEPHQQSCIDTPDRTTMMLARAPGLSVTLDPAHFVYAGTTTAEILTLLDHTRHVQFRAASLGVMQARMTDNTVDVGALVGGLAGRGYGGYLATEYVWHEYWDCDRVDNLSETALLRDLLRRAVEGLGGRISP